MTNEIVDPTSLRDDELIYWATHHAKRFKQTQRTLNRLQAIHELFLAEVTERGLTNELVESVNNG